MRAEDSEILSVVDDQDQVIGQRRRDDIHRLGLLHRATHVLVFRQDGQIFLQKRGLHKQESPGLWDSSVAGHVDAGETYDACCVREVREEIGIRLEEMPKRLFKSGTVSVNIRKLMLLSAAESPGSRVLRRHRLRVLPQR